MNSLEGFRAFTPMDQRSFLLDIVSCGCRAMGAVPGALPGAAQSAAIRLDRLKSSGVIDQSP